MLSHIFIRNIAIIREIDIDLREGLNILSGETGTGKSIVIQAIELALGGRGSAALIAEDADRALVQLVFQLSQEEKDALGRFADPADDTLILTRELIRSGRSLARINGEIVRLAELSQVASRLIDIHGQYDNQFFLDPKRHTAILDSFAADEAAPVKAQLRDAYYSYDALRSRLRALRKDRGEFLRQQDFMRFELEEIQSADPKAGEDEQLEERMRLLTNAEKIYDALQESYDILYRSDLERCVSLLEGIADLTEEYGALSASVADCAYALQDLREDIRQQRDAAMFSPEELDSVMRRLDVLDTLKRKYGGSLDQVLAHRAHCEAELSQALDAEDAERALTEQCRAARETVRQLSDQLSAIRKRAADALAGRMLAELQELRFSSVEFAVDIGALEGAGGQLRLTENGYDDVRFLFRGNKGASLKPLSDIASGGEISRISLAFKSVLAESDRIPTMIFDEIDTGISGRTASVAGEKMRQIGQHHQILCITHLPQIAAAGHHHFLISKEEDDARSYTRIQELTAAERIEEIARLLGGSTVTETTRRSAAELIDSFQPTPTAR